MSGSDEKSTKNVLHPHSRAKVELLGHYLSTFLQILSLSKWLDQIYIYDLMCGEGRYEDGSEGSPIRILETIRNHYFRNDRTCPRITVWLNDPCESDIEEGTQKIQRARRYCEEIYRPPSVTVEYFERDWRTLIDPALDRARSQRRSRSLLFIDPHGYKSVDLDHIRDALEPGNTELIVFIPASFQHRFAKAAMGRSWPGAEPLRKFLLDLFGDDRPQFSSAEDYVWKIRDALRSLLGDGRFVDSFTLEASPQNVYALFFFTSNARGFEKMLEAKWEMDKVHGTGFVARQQDQHSLFERAEVDNYAGRLTKYIRAAEHRTNEELFLFGLQNGYLPKHTHQTLKSEAARGVCIERISLDGKPARGYYIGYKPKRRIAVRIRQRNQRQH